MKLHMAILLKIISFLLCCHLHQVCANECDRRLMGSRGVVSSYNFPLDTRENQVCNYEHRFEGFDEGTVNEICFQFKRFNLSANSELYIGGENYSGRGALSMSNLCIPVTNNAFQMTYSGVEPNPGFFANYYVVTEDASAAANAKMDLTTKLLTREENVFCNSPDLFQCFDGKKCIDSSLQCDEEFHCDDKSDEAYATARCEGANGHKSLFRAVNISSLPAELSDYGVTRVWGWWEMENCSRDSHYGPKEPHVSGYYFRSSFTKYDIEVAFSYEIEEDLYKDNTSYCLSFWYHMNGKDSGKLEVRWGPPGNYNRPKWERLGDHKSVWLKAEVQRDPTALDGKIIQFFGDRGSENAQIAVQDISVMPGPCHSNADYELADDISCTFEDGMCRWMNDSDWNIVETNDTDSSTPPAVQGLFYLEPADSSSLTLKSPFLTRRREEACFVMKAYSTEDNRFYVSQSDGTETEYHIDGKPEWQMFKLPIEGSEDPNRVILRFHNDRIFLDDFVYAEQACNNIDIVRCLFYQYMCSEEFNCLESSQRCNGKRECLLGDDEDDCESCKNSAYKCENNTCIQSEYRCDGVPHCISGSDEENCDFSRCELTNGAFFCRQNRQCVPAGSKCDGIEQCRDGSDELDCAPKCENDSEYMCDGTSECISDLKVCNGVEDCPNGDDEENCNQCRNEAFLCDNKQCVPVGSRCDEIEQCRDGSDEGDFCYSRTSPGPTDPGTSLNGGQIAGIVVGSLLAVGIVVVLVVLLYLRSKKGSPPQKSPLPNISEQSGYGYQTQPPPQGVMLSPPTYQAPVNNQVVVRRAMSQDGRV